MHMYEPQLTPVEYKACLICGTMKREFDICTNCDGNLGGSYVYAPDFTVYRKELEDKVEVLEEALEQAETELSYKEAQLELALMLAAKAHELHEEIDRLHPYKDQPMLPFGDMPE